jgi:hypothetical protein
VTLSVSCHQGTILKIVLEFVVTLLDDAAGLHDTNVIYVDTNIEQLETIPDTYYHRSVDLELVAADKAGQSHF